MKDQWVERTFNFEFDFAHYPEFIERLMATPFSLELLIQPIPGNLLKIRKNNAWSIQENVGHLILTDDLFIGRLDDYESGTKSLRPADVSGRRTDEAKFNTQAIQDLLHRFREKRLEYIQRLNNLDRTFFSQSAWHPRLERPMRLCDMLYFQAEHDDHHMNKIKHLHQSFF